MTRTVFPFIAGAAMGAGAVGLASGLPGALLVLLAGAVLYALNAVLLSRETDAARERAKGGRVSAPTTITALGTSDLTVVQWASGHMTIGCDADDNVVFVRAEDRAQLADLADPARAERLAALIGTVDVARMDLGQIIREARRQKTDADVVEMLETLRGDLADGLNAARAAAPEVGR